MFMRLVGLCAFLLVQALQFEHNVDQSQGNTHTDCVICENTNEPLTDDHAPLTLVHIAYNESNELQRDHLISAGIPDRTQLLRGPPAFS